MIVLNGGISWQTSEQSEYVATEGKEIGGIWISDPLGACTPTEVFHSQHVRRLSAFVYSSSRRSRTRGRVSRKSSANFSRFRRNPTWFRRGWIVGSTSVVRRQQRETCRLDT